MHDRLPTLVTYRSAQALRDDGIRYGYLKAGMYAGYALGLISGGVALYLILTGSSSGWPTELMIFNIGANIGGLVCSRFASFPHTPRLTLEELNVMANDMGLPQAIFRQTDEAVLHGSFDEFRAIEQTNVILARAQASRVLDKTG